MAITKIDKPVRRLTRHSYNVLYVSSRKARPIVLAILPGDIFEFREHGRKKRWRLPIEEAFKEAVRRQVAADKAKRKKKGAKRMK